MSEYPAVLRSALDPEGLIAVAGGDGSSSEQLILSPAAAAFGDVTIGSAAQAITFTAINTTSSPVMYVSSTGAQNFQFQSGSCHLVTGEVILSAGAQCSFTVLFAPKVAGVVSGSISLSTVNGPVVFQLSGTGVAGPTLVFNPPSANFGAISVGSSSRPLTITATNNTASAVTYLTSTNIPGLGQFNLQAGSCQLMTGQAILAAGASCSFAATFSPTTAGLANASVSVQTAAGIANYVFTGIGVSAGVPVANAGGPYTGLVGQAISFNGSQSTAPSGQTLSYAWSFGDGSTATTANPTHTYSSTGTYTAFLQVTDMLGATSTASAGVSVTNNNALTILSAISPLPNAAGWNTSAVTVSFTCADDLFKVTSCPAPVVVSTAGGNQSISVTARDSSGKTATAQVVLNIELKPPTITAVVTPTPNAAGWDNSPTTVTYTCTPSTSPITVCAPPEQFLTEVSAQLSTGSVTDVAGNSATTSVVVKVDLTPPVLNVSLPTNGSTIALSSGSIGISGTVGDNSSGVASVTCGGALAVLTQSAFSCNTRLVPGANTITIQAADVAGNVTTSPLKLTYAPAPSITFSSPANLSITNISPVTVNGTVSDPAATLTINGISVPQGSGSFSIPVPLVEGLNVLSAVATAVDGASGSSVVEITLDTTPPHVNINSPAQGTTTTTSSVTVSGLANDVVVGTVNSGDVQVTVNGIAAQVANRSFSATNVPLAIGLNTIKAVGRDRAGNSASTSITVNRVLPNQPPAPSIGKAVLTQWLNVISGNNQSGVVGQQLSSPVVVSLSDPANHPLANQAVIFKVASNNGFLSSGGTPLATAVVVMTDTNGQAQVTWTLGQRAGAGNNMLQVSSALAVSPLTVSATGLTGAAVHVVVDSGNEQTGVLGQPLPFPFVVDVIDAGHNRVPGVPVTFTVKKGGGTFASAPSAIITSDSNGRAIAILTAGVQEGINNNIVEATVAGNAGLPAAFVATAKAPGSPADTTITGVVLDNSNVPIPGVTVHLYKTNQGNANNLPVQIGTPVQTDQNGAFLISPAPVGFFKLMADGGTATGKQTFPVLEYDIVTVAGIENTVGMPIYLPALDTVNKVCVDETHGGTLTLPQYPGFALTILPGSATFPGGARTGCVSATPVNGDKVPMAPGFGQQPRFIVTIQPVGTMFNPPAPLTLPNVDGLKPNAVTEMYSYDHDLSMFTAIGTGTVTPDGSQIVSDAGVGVLKAGWHCGGDPNTTGSAGTCPMCQKCTGSDCAADSSQDGKTAPDDKCMACSNGSLVQLPLNDTKTTLTASIEFPAPVIEEFDNFINKFKAVGLTGELSAPSVEYMYTSEPCCSKDTGPGTKTSGEISGKLGGFTLRGQIYPPAAEIPPPFDIPINLGFFKAVAKGEITGGISATLEAEVSGKLGHQTNPCSEDTTLQQGCFYADAGATITPEVTADLNLKVSYDCEDCFISSVEASFKVTGVDLKWPINIEGIKYNGEDDCKSGLSHGTISAPEGTLTSGLDAEAKATVGKTTYSFEYEISLECTVTLDALPVCGVK